MPSPMKPAHVRGMQKMRAASAETETVIFEIEAEVPLGLSDEELDDVAQALLFYPQRVSRGPEKTTGRNKPKVTSRRRSAELPEPPA